MIVAYASVRRRFPQRRFEPHLLCLSRNSSCAHHFRPRKKAKLADAKKALFHVNDGDLLTMLNVYEKWKMNGRKGQWCRENFIHGRVLHEIEKIREQLCDTMNALVPVHNIYIHLVMSSFPRQFRKFNRFVLIRRNMSIRSAGYDSTRVLKSICSGLIRNVAQRKPGRGHAYTTLPKNEEVYIHPGSAVFRQNPQWYVSFKISTAIFVE